MEDEIIIGIQKQENSNKKQNKKNKNNKAVKNTAYKSKTSSGKKKNLNSKKKSKKNKLSSKVKSIILIISFFIIMAILLTSSIFNISNINVNGNNKVSAEEIISLSKIEKYNNLFKFNKLQSVEAIKENAYIEDVEIHRKIPNKVVIDIKERVAKYMLQFADSYVYINNQGYMLEISNKKLDIPILVGTTTDLSNIQAGNRINLEDLKKMDIVNNIFETANSNEIGHLITKIDISNEKNYTLILETEGKTVYLGDCSELNTRVVFLKGILEAEKGKSGEIFLNVDLNEQRVYFRPSA